MRTAQEFCAKAADLTGGDRAVQHGDKTTNFNNIARLWTAYLTNAGQPRHITALDVAHMMALMKVARTQSGTFNPDDYVDLAGYAGCAGEIAMEQRGQLKLDGAS